MRGAPVRIIVSFRTISASRREINHRTDANERALGGITWFHSRKAFADNDEDMVGRFISGRRVCVRSLVCIETSGKLVSQV